MQQYENARAARIAENDAFLKSLGIQEYTIRTSHTASFKVYGRYLDDLCTQCSKTPTFDKAADAWLDQLTGQLDDTDTASSRNRLTSQKRGFYARAIESPAVWKTLIKNILIELHRLRWLHLLVEIFEDGEHGLNSNDCSLFLLELIRILFINVHLHFLDDTHQTPIDQDFVQYVATTYLKDRPEPSREFDTKTYRPSEFAQVQQLNGVICKLLFRHLEQSKIRRDNANSHTAILRFLTLQGTPQDYKGHTPLLEISINDQTTLDPSIDSQTRELWDLIFTEDPAHSCSETYQQLGDNKRMYEYTAVRESDIQGAGDGLFASRDIVMDTRIGLYHGDYSKRINGNLLAYVVCSSDTEWTINGMRRAGFTHNAARAHVCTIGKANNVCGPSPRRNIKFVEENIEIHGVTFMLAFAQATRDIEAGEELLVEYSTSDRYKTTASGKRCTCRSEFCKGRTFPRQYFEARNVPLQ